MFIMLSDVFRKFSSINHCGVKCLSVIIRTVALRQLLYFSEQSISRVVYEV